MPFLRPLPLAIFAFAALGLTPSLASAWGSSGHRMIGALAIEALPEETPSFLRTRASIEEVSEIAREPDRSRGAGQPHDADLDPGHFIDLDDEAKTFGSSPILDMPKTREEYETTLRAHGSSLTKGGYLYYNMLDGWEQVVKDFAYWRIETASLKTLTDPAKRTWLIADQARRERLILRDLGWWSHFVGDGSQPMHVSVHYNGWGDGPNPKGFTQARIHLPFEGAFVRDNVTEPGVRAAMTPLAICPDPIQVCVSNYLAVTHRQLIPLFELWGQNGFKNGQPEAVAFTTARVAAGASALRDLTVKAWRASEDGAVGFPLITVRAVEAGAPTPFAALYGDD